jgi:hypothetical protein
MENVGGNVRKNKHGDRRRESRSESVGRIRENNKIHIKQNLN